MIERGIILGAWDDDTGDHVFPRAFVLDLLEHGEVTDAEAVAMLSARFDARGRVRASEICAGEVPAWAMRRLQQWRYER